MVEDNKRGIMLAVGAVTALIGAALLYHYVSGDDETEDGGSGGILEDLKEAGLDEVKRSESTGGLDPLYTCKMLNFVTLTARKRRHDERTAAINKRREAYKNEDWDTYRNIVREQF